MGNMNPDDRELVLERTDEFIRAIKATPVGQRFAEAKRRFEGDKEVQSLMETIQNFQKAQQSLQSTDIQSVRKAQTRLRSHPVVQEFVAARDAVGVLLRDANREVSEVLGIDVAQTVAPASGCC